MTNINQIQKSVVTGSSGFIGSSLVKNLVKKNHHVIAIDKNKSNQKICESFVRDVSNPFSLDEFVDENTVIYHMAAKASVPESVKDPMDDFNNTCYGIFQALETAKRKNCKINQ